MSSEEPPVDDTLISMITNLKPKIKSDIRSFECESPLKRSLSSSGLFDYVTPAKKVRRDSSNLDYLASPRETRRLRTDLLEARNTITSLENRVRHMHNVRREMQIMFDNEQHSLEQLRTHDRKMVEELESQLQAIRKREVEFRTELNEAQGKFDMLKLTTDQRIQELEKEFADLKRDAVTETDLQKEELLNLNRDVEELKIVLEAAQEDAEAHKKLAAELDKRLSEKNAIERNVELKDQALQKARMELKELEYVRENYLEYQQQVKTHQHKLAIFSDLEKENQQLKEESKRLKDAVHNKLLLEEEVHDLKNRLVNYKEQEKKLAVLQAQQVQSDMYLNEWRAVARGICESTGSDSTLPHLLRSVVEHLQQQEINLTADKVQLESQLNNASHESKVARSELEKNQKHLHELQMNMQHRQNLIHRLQKKLLLVSRERDSYRLQLDSYERDLTMCMTSTNAAQASAQQTQRERIENLERIVDGYRDMVTKLETDLQNVEPNTSTEAVPIRTEQMTRLQEEVDKLKLDNDHLRQQRQVLEIQLEQYVVGSDTSSARIVHLAKNPLADCIAQRDNQVEKLQEEVQRLKRKIRNMEEGLEASKLSDTTLNMKEVQELKEQLKTAENQILRLKDYFKSSMQEFRNVIYMLLGYKIDKLSNSQYKLTSMYAEQQEDQICFQLNSEGALNLLENDFSSTLDEMVDLHLRHQKSIPVFLSAITMDLFNNRTMATKTFEIDDD